NPGNWGAETPLAATPRYEAYPSIAYDSAGTLWVAYEEGEGRWGKDFGAYETTRFALYHGRAARLRGIDKNRRALATAMDPGAVLPGTPERKADAASHQGASVDWTVPNSVLAKARRDSATPIPPPAPRNTSPRLSVDSSGRLWLAVRSAHPIWWNPL